MTCHRTRNFLLAWHSLTCLAGWTDDVSGDCVELLACLMTWQVNPVQLLEFGRRRHVECVWHVGARGQCCRRSVLERAGMQDVGSSLDFHQWICLVVIYTMVCLKTRFDNFDFWVWIKHPLFSRTSSDTSCWVISEIKHT